MYPTGRILARQVPRWVRVCLNASLIVGIFAMHNVVAGGEGRVIAHHMVSPVTQAVSVAGSATMSMVESVSDQPDSAIQMVTVSDGDTGMSMSDCGGLMILCIAMIAGTSLYILLRRRLHDRLLWQLPPPQSLSRGRATPPFERLTPLQRSSVLRR